MGIVFDRNVVETAARINIPRSKATLLRFRFVVVKLRGTEGTVEFGIENTFCYVCMYACLLVFFLFSFLTLVRPSVRLRVFVAECHVCAWRLVECKQNGSDD